VANGGTGVTSSTGTGSVVLSASPTFSGTANFSAININNGAADGGEVVWQSSGFNAWTMDNNSGRLRGYYNVTENFSFFNNGGLALGQSYTGTTPTANGAIIQGNVGIGTTTPYRKLSVKDTVAAAQVSVAYDDTRDTQLQTDSSGDFVINPSGDDVRINDDNLWVCAGGSCPGGTISGTGNAIIENKLLVGTSTRTAVFSVADTGSSGYVDVSPNDGAIEIGSGNDAASFIDFKGSANLSSDYTGRILYQDGTGFSLSTNGAPQLYLTSAATNAAKLGIGTSTPTEQLSAAGLLFIGANGATGMGTATSTFYGDIKINGKLDVSTIDPVYTIDGTKYATYGHSTIGIHEEVALKVTPASYDAKRKLYDYAIAFPEAPMGSDVWLFYQVTDFGKNWTNLVVTLTPGFDGRAFYEQDIANKTLHILTDKSGPVSVRLMGSRYDYTKWLNLRPDQDGNDAGTHVISSKPESESTQ
ncbi:hypothetical protein K8R03_02870, partial [Candidatus Kaiserbacteria bacterium]|nr:hypothetical protein [Candidatus Kaiserbacteria bacterium]